MADVSVPSSPASSPPVPSTSRRRAKTAAASSADNGRHRLWVVVTNIDDETQRHTEKHDSVDYYQYSVEKGSHLHLQGFAYYKNPVRFSSVQKAFPHSHIEVAKGSIADNIKYTSKLDETHVSGPYCFGTRPSQGQRTDLENACELVKTAGTKRVAQDMPTVYVKYHRGLKELESMLGPSPTTWRDVTVIWLWGSTGVGKTRRAVESNPDPDDRHFAPVDGKWWDGYIRQSTVIFDEFYGNPVWPIALMLRLLDGYIMQLEIKGGHTRSLWTTVYITSNLDPATYYAGESEERRSAFFRRITTIEHMQ